MLEARFLNAEGNVVEGYFWYTAADEVDYAVDQSLERASKEDLVWDRMLIIDGVAVDENGEEVVLATCWAGQEPVYW